MKCQEAGYAEVVRRLHIALEEVRDNLAKSTRFIMEAVEEGRDPGPSDLPEGMISKWTPPNSLEPNA